MGQVAHVCKLKESEEEVTVLVGVGSPEEVGRATLEVRGVKNFESRKRE